MKTASFPAVIEAKKAASGQLAFYKEMMTEEKKASSAKPAKSSEKTSASRKKQRS